MKTQLKPAREPSFIGIDYHKRYSVYCVVDSQGEVMERGRIEHAQSEGFLALVGRWRGCRVVFEASMNWHWLYEILERGMAGKDIVLANAYKTRIIAEAQVKTDRVDAFILAQLLRGNLISREIRRGQSYKINLDGRPGSSFSFSWPENPASNFLVRFIT